MTLSSLLSKLVENLLAAQFRRFIAVGSVAAGIQMVLLWLFVDIARINYLLGAGVSIELTIILAYVLNNAWTFQHSQNAGTIEYLYGLFKTNVVRGTAIPLQLGILFLLVDIQQIQYLIANVAAIGVSGIYRYILDARWTWG